MTYFHTDNHTLLNDDGCDVQSEYMCQIQGLDIGLPSFTCRADIEDLTCLSALVLLNLLNELRNSDKMRGLQSHGW